jgi:hypothetical protein
MGNSESSVATVSDYAESQVEETNTNTLAQNVVNDMTSVVAQQEMFIQKLTAEKAALQVELDTSQKRRGEYKALCKKNNLI